MKRLLSTLTLSLLAAIALPMRAIAHPLPQPLNTCGYMPIGDQWRQVCTFHPTTDDAILVLLPESIRPVRRNGLANFIYWNIDHPSDNIHAGRGHLARMDCNTRDHWDIYRPEGMEEIPATSDAAQGMLNLVCRQAGF